LYVLSWKAPTDGEFARRSVNTFENAQRPGYGAAKSALPEWT